MISLKLSNIHDPLTFDIGDDWIIQVQCTNSDGSNMDLTGAAVNWKLSTLATPTVPATVIKNYNVGSGISIVSPPTLGKAIIWLPKTESAVIVAADYADKCTVTTAGGLVSTQSKGRITAVSWP